MKRFVAIGLVLVVVAIAGAVGYIQYNNAHFWVTSVSPQNGNTQVDAIQPVIIRFNHDISAQTAQSFQISPAVQGKVSVSGSTLTFTPNDQYGLGTSYTVTLPNPISAGGQVGSTVTSKFTVNYVAYSNLSKSQQQTEQSRTDSIQKTDPLLQYLPHQTQDYQITYSVDHTSNGANTIYLTITTYAILNDPSQEAAYTQQTQKDRQEALDYISSKGVSTTKYPIIYNPPQGNGTD